MAEYIDFPIETDPEQLAQDAFDYLQAKAPGWLPNPGNLDTWLLEAVARMAAETRDVASRVPVAVFRRFGQLVGVTPIDATAASVDTTWTAIDAAGYTIPAGTLAGIRDSAGDLVAFQVVNDTVIAAGTTTLAGVTLVAVDTGAAGSGLGADGGTVELIDQLDFVSSIVQEAITTGGVDAEDDTVYLDRLASELRLLAPRPIVPSDFEAIARETAGIDRALAIDLYVPAVDEVETVTVDATGGTYTLTFDAQTTAAIAWNADAATLQAALEALSNIAPGDVVVTGGPGGTAPLAIEFRGAYAGTDVTEMTADSTGLTGGAATATVATTVPGSAAVTDSPRTITVAVVDENGNTPSSGSIATLQTDLEARREVNFLVYVIGPTYTQVDVAFTITVYDGYDPDDVLTRAQQAVTDFLSPVNWGRPLIGDLRLWLDVDTVNRLDVATVINNTQGVDKVTALTMGVHGGALSTSDIALTGPAAMPQPVTIAGTVS